MQSDIRLAENVPEIDLILGGHEQGHKKRKVINSVQKLSLQNYFSG